MQTQFVDSNLHFGPASNTKKRHLKLWVSRLADFYLPKEKSAMPLGKQTIAAQVFIYSALFSIASSLAFIPIEIYFRKPTLLFSEATYAIVVQLCLLLFKRTGNLWLSASTWFAFGAFYLAIELFVLQSFGESLSYLFLPVWALSAALIFEKPLRQIWLSAFLIILTIHAVATLIRLQDTGLQKEFFLTYFFILWGTVASFAFGTIATELRGRFTNSISEKNERISSLLKIISHDIRSPLQVAMFNLDSVRKIDPDLKATGKISDSLDTITSIINQVRDLQLLSDSNRSLHTEPVSIKDALTDVQALFSEALKAKSISLKITTSKASHGELYILTNKTVFTYQVLANVISNSIKFSNPGSTIFARVYGTKRWATLVIADHGVGIEPMRIRNIFEPQSAASTLGTAKEKGTGFGMQILNSAIRSLNGKIFIRSTAISLNKVVHGTVVRIKLPIKPS